MPSLITAGFGKRKNSIQYITNTVIDTIEKIKYCTFIEILNVQDTVVMDVIMENKNIELQDVSTLMVNNSAEHNLGIVIENQSIQILSFENSMALFYQEEI